MGKLKCCNLIGQFNYKTVEISCILSRKGKSWVVTVRLEGHTALKHARVDWREFDSYALVKRMVSF